jgi:hypothetical protein
VGHRGPSWPSWAILGVAPWHPACCALRRCADPSGDARSSFTPTRSAACATRSLATCRRPGTSSPTTDADAPGRRPTRSPWRPMQRRAACGLDAAPPPDLPWPALFAMCTSVRYANTGQD